MVAKVITAAAKRAKEAAKRRAKAAAAAAKRAATSKPAIAAYGVTGGYQASKVNLGKGSPKSSSEYRTLTAELEELRGKNMRGGGMVKKTGVRKMRGGGMVKKTGVRKMRGGGMAKKRK
jgi:hypothetical protein